MSDNQKKTIITVVLLICYIVMEVKKMPWWQWLFWTFAIVFVSFLWLPEIKGFFINNKGAGMERVEAKVDKAISQYDTFQQTVLPILKTVIATVIASPYSQMTPKVEQMLAFYKFVVDINHKISPDSEMRRLTDELQSTILDAFSDELNYIKPGSKDYISTGQPHLYFEKGSMKGVDLSALKSLRDKMNPSEKRNRYTVLLQELEQFSDRYL